MQKENLNNQTQNDNNITPVTSILKKDGNEGSPIKSVNWKEQTISDYQESEPNLNDSTLSLGSTFSSKDKSDSLKKYRHFKSLRAVRAKD
jgi:hypothetical protein